jgi:hypothetical protein
MGQFSDKVEQRRIELEAEEWAKGIKGIHAHSLSSMWYDNRPQDTEGKGVIDIEYNNGRVVRTLDNGTKITMHKGLDKVDVVREYQKSGNFFKM